METPKSTAENLQKTKDQFLKTPEHGGEQVEAEAYYKALRELHSLYEGGDDQTKADIAEAIKEVAPSVRDARDLFLEMLKVGRDDKYELDCEAAKRGEISNAELTKRDNAEMYKNEAEANQFDWTDKNPEN